MSRKIKGLRIHKRVGSSFVPTEYITIPPNDYILLMGSREGESLNYAPISSFQTDLSGVLYPLDATHLTGTIKGESVTVQLSTAKIQVFKPTTYYATEDIVIKDGLFYLRNSSGIGDWVPSDWQLLREGHLLSELWKYTERGLEEMKEGGVLRIDGVNATDVPTVPNYNILSDGQGEVLGLVSYDHLRMTTVTTDRYDGISFYVNSPDKDVFIILQGTDGTSIKYLRGTSTIQIVASDGETIDLLCPDLNDGKDHKVMVDFRAIRVVLEVDDVAYDDKAYSGAPMNFDFIGGTGIVGEGNGVGYVWGVTLGRHHSWLMYRTESLAIDTVDYIGDNPLTIVGLESSVNDRVYIRTPMLGDD